MIDPKNARRLGWLSLVAFTIVWLIFLPTLMRCGGIDLDDWVERGTILYALVHDLRWIIAILVAVLLAEIRMASRGLWRSGIQELKEWQQRRSQP